MIYVHLATGFEEIEALTTVDFLRRAEIETQLVSMEETLEVTGVHGIVVKADVLFADAEYARADVIVLPGGMPGAENLMNHEALCANIRTFVELNRPVAAICAAPMVLGRLGLLEGKEATCFPGFEEDLKGAKLVDQKVVTCGRIITAKGPGCAMDFALTLIEMVKGRSAALAVKEGIVGYE